HAKRGGALGGSGRLELRMKYGSVCSGVEAATVAWHPFGWQAQWFSEIKKFPSAVLQHHYPDTPNHGDMTSFKEWPNDPINILVGGTPCQSFSVAGLRKGLSDPRGNLMLTYLAIAAQYQPKWLVWENVPGVLSSNRGRDFGTFLGALGKLGYGFAYRVLDAQYFGVAQRRRRVFVVGYLGDWKRAAAVLFERESLQGHSAPSREAREEIAETVTTRSGNGGGGGLGTDEACGGFLQPTYVEEVAHCLQTTANNYSRADGFNMIARPVTAGMGKGPRGTEGVEKNRFIAFGAQNSARQGDSVSEHVTPTLDKSKTPAVATHSVAGIMLSRNTSCGFSNSIDHAAAGYMAMHDMQVRRLTPRECERLQGFPDDYTQIPYRNKPAENCLDGPRYKAMGNSMAVPVMRWIGEWINMVENLI
ncbi:MAG: DNA cytosine methyltransferase, partial [Paracoccaceae bacterium]